jgi:hypothetical protein
MTENETLILVMQCSEIESSKYNYKELSEGEAELDICSARKRNYKELSEGEAELDICNARERNYKELSEGEAELDIICNAREIE